MFGGVILWRPLVLRREDRRQPPVPRTFSSLGNLLPRDQPRRLQCSPHSHFSARFPPHGWVCGKGHTGRLTVSCGSSGLSAQTQGEAELPGTSAPLPLPHIHTSGADNGTCEVCSLFLLSMPAQAALTCPDSHPPPPLQGSSCLWSRPHTGPRHPSGPTA